MGRADLFYPRYGGFDRVKLIGSRKPIPYTGMVIATKDSVSARARSWSAARFLCTSGAIWFMLHRVRQAYEVAALWLGAVEIGKAFVSGKEQNRQAEQIIPAGRRPHNC